MSWITIRRPGHGSGRGLALALAVLTSSVAACAAAAPTSISAPSAAAGSPADPVPSQPADPSTAPSASPTIAPRALRIVVLGDSIVMRDTGCGSACVHFDEQYATFLEGTRGGRVEVDNVARHNARIADLKAALDEPAVSEAIATADIVIVSIGYNDEPPPSASDAPCRRDPPVDGDEVRASMEAIESLTPPCVARLMNWYEPALDDVYARIASIGDSRPQVRVTLGVFDNLVGNPPFEAYPLAAATRHDIEAKWRRMKVAWNVRNCRVASPHAFTCVDLYHAFNGPSGDQPIAPYVVDDYTHLDARGQDTLASLLEPLDLSVLGPPD